MNPIVSVILPAYNAEDYISGSMESILNQTFEDYEFLIVNDGSIDRSKERIMSYQDKRIKYFENKSNQGLIKTLNKALYLAKGEYIARMDADDLCDCSRFQKQLDFFRQDKEVSILGTNQYIVDSEDVISHPLVNEENRIHLLLEPVVGHSSVMMKTKPLLINRLYYDKYALHAEDYKLWVDSSLCGLSIKNIREPLCGYRKHNNQISRTQGHVQKLVANQIRLGYAKYFFNNVVQGREKEYLLLLLGSSLFCDKKLMENVEYIYNCLLRENSRSRCFEQNFFESFFTQRFFNLKNNQE